MGKTSHPSSWLGWSWEFEDMVQQQPRGSEVKSEAAPDSRRARFRMQAGPSREQMQADRILSIVRSIPPPAALHFLAPGGEFRSGNGAAWPFAAVHGFPAQTWLEIDWEAIPASADPARGGGYKPELEMEKKRSRVRHMCRGERKQWQVSGIAGILKSLELEEGSVVVDFGCGSGALTLPLAAVFPALVFVGVDLKRKSVELLRQRAAAGGLPNVRAWCGSIQSFRQPFQACVALHACGSATDMALVQALDRASAYVVSPCCVGKLQLERCGGVAPLVYPRSQWLRSAISSEDFLFLARSADWSSYDRDCTDSQLHALCKAVVELDRNQAAVERDYVTSIFSLPNQAAGVVGISHILVGRPDDELQGLSARTRRRKLSP